MSRDLLSFGVLVLACACAAEETSLPAGSEDDGSTSTGSRGKKSGSAGSVSTSGKTGGTDEPDDEPSDGGDSSSDVGGSSSSGGKTSSGGKSSGGNAGTSGSSSGGSAPTGNGWRFPTNSETWAASYGEPSSAPGSSSVSWDSGVGNPENGSLELTVPFSGTDQKLDVSIGIEPTSFAGKTITAKVKLDSGLSTSPDHPGGAKLYVKTGDGFVYADGGWTNLEGDWASLSLNVSSPGGFIAGAHDPADVREIGVEIATGSQGSYAGASVHIDSIVY